MRLGVIADDLTGAVDTGVQFRKWGLSVGFLLQAEALSGVSTEAEVIVVNTDSREDPPAEAYRKVSEAALSLASLGVETFYKKVDSTLRGNIGAEIDAVMNATGAETAFIAPAYPAAGRTTRNGVHLVNGVPLWETEYAMEMDARESHVSSIINAQSKRKTGLVQLDAIRDGPEAIEGCIKGHRDEGAELIVFDAVAERDLLAVSEAGRGVRVFSGSAGLASELPCGLGLREVKPVLSIIGSIRSTTRSQARLLQERLGTVKVEVDTLRLLEGEGSRLNEINRCKEEVSAHLKGSEDVLITTMLQEGSQDQATADEKSIIGESLAEIASSALNGVEVSGLVLSGGATALAVFKALDITSAEILEEVQPGVPLLSLTGGLKAVTKAGGFGTRDTLIEAVNHLRRAQP